MWAGGFRVSGGQRSPRSGQERGGGVRGAHFLTGIRPSWFTCSFNFVYLGRQGQGSHPEKGHWNPDVPQGSPGAHAFRRKVFREAF